MIDLHQAKVQDQFMTRQGRLLTYLTRNERNAAYPNVLVAESGEVVLYNDSGHFNANKHFSGMDIISRVKRAGGKYKA